MEHRLLDTYITEEELWACTSCRACVTECPGVDRPARRHQPDAPQPGAHGVALPRGAAAGVRVARAKRIAVGVPCRRTAPRGRRECTSRRWPSWRSAASDPDILFWVGCMGSFDDRAKKITVAFARILQACDIKFAILGQEETLPRRSGAPHGQRVPLPDAGEGHDRDARPLRGADDRHALPALLPPDRQRVPAVRRQLRGHPPLDVHRAAAAGGARAAAHGRRDSGSPSRTTTPATSAATTTSTTRRARR